MMLHNILPVSLTLLAAIGAQASIRNYAGVARALLGARQSGLIDPSTLPQQCQAPCQPIVAVLNNDTCSSDATCLCTDTNSQSLEMCLYCGVSASLSPDDVQSAVDGFNTDCGGTGVSLTLSTSTSTGSGDGSTSSPDATTTPATTTPATTTPVKTTSSTTSSGSASSSTATGSGTKGSSTGGAVSVVQGMGGSFWIGLGSAAVIFMV